MIFLHNIRTVARYESKILYRSWFFKVFSVIAFFLIFWINLAEIIYYQPFVNYAISANIPYRNLMLLNIGQSIIAIFLASEFLKRDKKLDTSEVFYVRPLSNAEYVIGKVWGDLRVFFLLNILALFIVLIFNFIGKSPIDPSAYVFYFCALCIPSLIYIIGLSIFLMLVINSQAVTFVVLLGYIAMSMFYIDDKFFYLFDYLGKSIPMMKSDITGYSNIMVILNQRMIYLLLGIVFILFSIKLFKRLPNSNKSVRPWFAAGFLFLFVAVLCGYNYIEKTVDLSNKRKLYVKLNNEYIHFPKIQPESFHISLEQLTDGIRASAEIIGTAKQNSDKFIFTLNPGFQIHSVTCGDSSLSYDRLEHLLIVDFGREFEQGESVSLKIEYSGRADESICCLDIEDDVFFEKKEVWGFSVDKRYILQSRNYLLLTPESYWYPVPGPTVQLVRIGRRPFSVISNWMLNLVRD
ncbi:MAG: hypothetical protein LUF90_02585 [Rikenellaceae bacterium]|nr:hypothetical protein [Rikenellaceae bacterium]